MSSLREFQNLSPQQWLDGSSRVLPHAVSAVLVVAIAWQLVQLTWLVLDREPEISLPLAVQPLGSAAARRGVDVQAIIRARPFGEAQEQAAQDPAAAPQTQMNLVLSAVLADDDPKRGLAIIGESITASKVYRVGDAIRSGTRLHEVYADRVILDRSGQLESLSLPRHSAPGAITMARAPLPAPAPSQFADNLRRIAETNPGAFAEVVRPQPVFANGVQRGYRVYPGRNRQQFAKLGLQPGDLVLSINGTPLDDPQRGLEIFNTMGSSDRVTVTVERNGRSQEMTLNTGQIALPEADPAEPSGQPGLPAPNNEVPVMQDAVPADSPE